MTLPADQLEQLDANFRTANYLSVAQLYLRENALLREPLDRRHIKARLLGTGAPCLGSISCTGISAV